MIQRSCLHRSVLCLFALVLSFSPVPAYAAPTVSFKHDPAFRLRSKPFGFRGVPNEDQVITRMISTSDGGVIITGSFTAFNRKSRQRILKLDPRLALDPSFSPRVNGLIADVASAPDGKIFIGGDFTEVDGLSRRGFARLLSSGAVDPDFDPLEGASGGVGNVTRVFPFSDGSLALFGAFNSVQGIRTDFSIARVGITGAVDTTFAINLATSGLASAGKSILLTEACELTPEGRLLVLGFGTDSARPGTPFEGSTVIESNGNRVEAVHDASDLLEGRHHERGSYADVSGSGSFISHEKFSASFKPLSETLYRFGAQGRLDPDFRIQNKIYFNSTAIQSDGSLLIAPQTVRIKTSGNRTSYSAKAIIRHYDRAGALQETLKLPALPGKAFEYRTMLPLSDGSLLVHVRTVTLSRRAGTGRTFRHFLIKVKP